MKQRRILLVANLCFRTLCLKDMFVVPSLKDYSAATRCSYTSTSHYVNFAADAAVGTAIFELYTSIIIIIIIIILIININSQDDTAVIVTRQ